jgi:ubiquinone/menaquinone biosynthesis C-methylase UbiE
MNSTETEAIKEQQTSWNNLSAGWKKWSKKINYWYAPISEKIIELASLKESDIVLDIATGTGEPGHSAAKYIPLGQVKGIDISEEMVNAANEFARGRSINNYEALHYDGINIPFNYEFFDSVISRCGIFFFPDTNHILGEIKRVLKPGGTLSLSAWLDINQNQSSLLVQNIAADFLKQPLPDNNAPGPFRFSDPNILITAIEKAGFKNIRMEEVGGEAKFDSADEFWLFISEVQSTIINALKENDDKFREELRQEVFKALKPYEKDGRLIFTRGAYCVGAVKS